MTKKTMLDYIKESAPISIENIERSQELTKSLVDAYLAEDYEAIWIVASGSSYNGALAARHFIRNVLGKEIKLIQPASFVAYEHNISDKDFVFVISQTGYSTNSLRALKKIRDLGYPAIGVTGNTASDFKEASDLAVDYGVGIETVTYVTKGVTTLVLFLVLFAIESALLSGKLSHEGYDDYKKELRDIMAAHPAIIEKSQQWINQNLKALSAMEVLYMCAYGSNFGTVYEGVLKVGETVHIPSLPYELEEFIHGPNLQLTPKYSLMIFDNGDHTHDKALEIFTASTKLSDKSFLITNTLESDDPRVIKIYKTKTESLNPLVYLPVVQVLAWFISSYLNTQQHPLLKEFNAVAKSKSENYKEDQ